MKVQNPVWFHLKGTSFASSSKFIVRKIGQFINWITLWLTHLTNFMVNLGVDFWRSAWYTSLKTDPSRVHKVIRVALLEIWFEMFQNTIILKDACDSTVFDLTLFLVLCNLHERISSKQTLWLDMLIAQFLANQRVCLVDIFSREVIRKPHILVEGS